MKRRTRVSLYASGVLVVLLVIFAPIAIRAAVKAAVADLRKHEKLDATVGRIGVYDAGVLGVGVKDIEVRTLEGETVASADAIAFRPRVRSLRKTPGFWVGARGLRVEDPRFIQRPDATYDATRGAVRTLHRNFNDSMLVFRLKDLNLATYCGDLESDTVELRLVARNRHKLELTLNATDFDVAGTLQVYRDSVDVNLTGGRGEALFRIHSQTPAPGWEDIVPRTTSVSVVDERDAARLAQLLDRCATAAPQSP